jgi:hypothetical protein
MKNALTIRDGGHTRAWRAGSLSNVLAKRLECDALAPLLRIPWHVGYEKNLRFSAPSADSSQFKPISNQFRQKNDEWPLQPAGAAVSFSNLLKYFFKNHFLRVCEQPRRSPVCGTKAGLPRRSFAKAGHPRLRVSEAYVNLCQPPPGDAHESIHPPIHQSGGFATLCQPLPAIRGRLANRLACDSKSTAAPPLAKAAGRVARFSD